ncbi:MAG: TetR/AcrR family transcriptional regulator [Desulfobacteraceae bacterium]|nr:TetR/AcrR family transcriptional regulator [Desulfobacteraceae bacterium]
MKNTNPPGRIKIIKSLSTLMEKKDFDSITTSEIASEAGVTEGLIYKYFKDKKDLLYKILEEHFQIFQEKIDITIENKTNSIERLEVIINTSLESWTASKVFAKILLLEVRSYPDYYKSRAYELIKVYAKTVTNIIGQGIEAGEIRKDIDKRILTKIILGAIEHACIGDVIFERDIDINHISKNICKTIFKGIQP